MSNGIKVLIIEDRRENIVFLANNALKPKGYKIITARDGETGLRKALEENPDLIITDLNLPKMNGLDILADLRERGCPTPAIVMTFQGSEEIAVRAFRLGAKDYLIKPFTVDEFDVALERALGAKEAATPSVDRMQLEAQQRETDALAAEVERLTARLAHQECLTTDARQTARSMMLFIQHQQQESLRRQQVLKALWARTKSLFEAFNQLVIQADVQVAHFHRPPHDES